MPRNHVVVLGDCIASIGYQYGFFPDTLWDAAENAELRKLRKDPNVLSPGDVVAIPDKRVRTEAAVTDKLHRYRRKGVPERLRIQLMLGEQPRSEEAYAIEIDGVVVAEGLTDADGQILVPIVPNARSGRILMKNGQEQIELQLGHLAPIDKLAGVQMRLQNLGYYSGPLDGEMSVDLQEALVCFQVDHGLEPAPELDDATKAALVNAYGG